MNEDLRKVDGAFDKSKTHTEQELHSLGGIFYSMGKDQWCDLPTSSFVFVPEKGIWIKWEATN